MFSSISFSVFLFLQNETTTTTTMIIQMDRLLANGHPIGPASCKWSSGWTSLLQMIIGMDRPLVNDHLDGPASCKWSSGWTGLLQMIRIQIWDLHCLLDQVFSLFLGKLMEQAHTPTLLYFFFWSFVLPSPSRSSVLPKNVFSFHFHLTLCSSCAPIVSKRRSDLRKLQSRSTRSEGTMLVAITKDKKSRPKSDLISKPERKSVGCAIFDRWRGERV